MRKGSQISIIIAIAKNGAIGLGNDLPWKNLKGDMRHFMATTKGRPVIAARKTHESILTRGGGKPLLGRHTMVLTRDADYPPDNRWLTFNDLETLLEYADSLNDEVFVIGGAELYKLTLPVADYAYVSIVDAEPEADAFFPLDSFSQENGWVEKKRTHYEADEENDYPFDVVEYEKASRFVYVPNARSYAQRSIMRQIRADGVDPFAEENLGIYHKKPILWQSHFWNFSESQYPREGASLYLIAFYRRLHIESIGELPKGAMDDLTDGFLFVQKTICGIEGTPPNGLVIRSGPVEKTGGSVRMLHAHWVIPETSVRFKIGEDA